MAASIKAELRLVNATGQGVPGTGLPGQAGQAGGDPGISKSLSDIARYFNRPSQIFGAGGASILESLGLGTAGAAGAGLVAAAAPIAAAIAISAAAIIIPHKILSNEFDKMDNALAALKAQADKYNSGVGAVAKEQMATQAAQDVTGTAVNTQSAADYKDLQAEINRILSDNVITEKEFNNLGDLETKNAQERAKILDTLATNTSMSIGQHNQLLALSMSLLDQNEQIMSIRQAYLENAHLNVQSMEMEARLAGQLASNLRDAATASQQIRMPSGGGGGGNGVGLPAGTSLPSFTVNGMEGTFSGRVETLGGKNMAVGIRTS